MNLQTICLASLIVSVCRCLPDQGKWDFTINKPDEYVGVSKSLYNGSDISIKITCTNHEVNLTVGWVLRETPCWNEYVNMEIQGPPQSNLSYFYKNPGYLPNTLLYNATWYQHWPEQEFTCDKVVLPEVAAAATSAGAASRPAVSDPQPAAPVVNVPAPAAVPAAAASQQLPPVSSASQQLPPVASASQERRLVMSTPLEKLPTPLPLISRQRRAAAPHRQIRAPSDGIFLLVVHVTSRDPHQPPRPLNITVSIEMRTAGGYLSAADWPYLPFYSVMCAVYVLYALGWLAVCGRQWRELLRIQFWIGGVIAIGMLEKAVFLAEYETVNRTGHSVWGAVVFAELVSCAKRALARMLVIIVSLGFGITKPRLGPLLHRVMAVGLFFFMFASIESCTRALKPKNDLSGGTMGTAVVLALIDSGICWWVFSALLNTTRTLRLRRNEVKLTLYRHFTNTLMLSVLASVGFMVWSVKFHRAVGCLRQWKNLWADEACWHVLFSIILLVIMLLWRPTNNNQRYAFTPLLDAGDEDEEDELFRSDAYHDLKMRSRGQSSPGEGGRHARRSRHNSDDDLKWVEDNIPASMSETALPIVDSDEEVMQAKFEISKMQ